MFVSVTHVGKDAEKSHFPGLWRWVNVIVTRIDTFETKSVAKMANLMTCMIWRVGCKERQKKQTFPDPLRWGRMTLFFSPWFVSWLGSAQIQCQSAALGLSPPRSSLWHFHFPSLEPISFFLSTFSMTQGQIPSFQWLSFWIEDCQTWRRYGWRKRKLKVNPLTLQ